MNKPYIQEFREKWGVQAISPRAMDSMVKDIEDILDRKEKDAKVEELSEAIRIVTKKAASLYHAETLLVQRSIDIGQEFKGNIKP